MTHAEECHVVADEVVDDSDFLRGLSPSLEQAGGEDGGQFFAGHVIEVGALLDPGITTTTTTKKRNLSTRSNGSYQSRGITLDPSRLRDTETHTEVGETLGLSPNCVCVCVCGTGSRRRRRRSPVGLCAPRGGGCLMLTRDRTQLHSENVLPEGSTHTRARV